MSDDEKEARRLRYLAAVRDRVSFALGELTEPEDTLDGLYDPEKSPDKPAELKALSVCIEAAELVLMLLPDVGPVEEDMLDLDELRAVAEADAQAAGES